MASYQENLECARKKTEIFYKKLLSLKKGGCVKTLAQPFSIIYSPVIFSFVYAAFFSFIW